MLAYQTIHHRLHRLEQFHRLFKMTKMHGAKKWLVQITSACPGHAESVSAFFCLEQIAKLQTHLCKQSSGNLD